MDVLAVVKMEHTKQLRTIHRPRPRFQTATPSGDALRPLEARACCRAGDPSMTTSINVGI